VSEPPSRADLQKQYELVLQEYRFQVQLNWDRTKHYLVFNTAIFGAAGILYKNATTWPPQAAVTALLVVAAFNSYAGMRAIELGHEFYQNIRHTKAELEKALGLDQYAIRSTPGMRRDHAEAPEGTPDSGRKRRRKIVEDARSLLKVLCAFAAAGAIYSAYAAAVSFRAGTTDCLPKRV
jgi:hypothetical protein